MATVDQVLAAYLELRNQRDDLKKVQAEDMAPINEKMRACQVWVQKQLQSQGLTNFKGSSGIAFLQTDTTVSVKDWDAMFAWIQAQNLWQFLEHRVSKSVVTDYIEATKEIPPGLGVSSEVSAHIRKS
jgi:hypothetical protein